MSSIAPAPPPVRTDDPTARLLSALEELTDQLAAARRSMDVLLATMGPAAGVAAPAVVATPPVVAAPTPGSTPAPPVRGAGPTVDEPAEPDAYVVVPDVLAAHVWRPAVGASTA